MATKASNQITLVDLTDAYSVILSNEAHTFVGDNDSVKYNQTAKIVVKALQGNNVVNCTIGSMTTATGVSAVSDGKTPSPTITVSVTTACTTGGSIEIPVTIGSGADAITINKTFSYAIAYSGAAGTGISNTSITYQVSTDGSTPPTGNWDTSVPTVPAGQWLWTRTETTFSDGNKTVAYSVSRNGTDGDDGKGITSTAIDYAISTSGTKAPTSGWNSTIPTLVNNHYLWTRTTITYTDSSTSVVYSVSYKASDGVNGQDAIVMTIESSNGTIFKNTAIATTLTAKVYKGGVEVSGTNLAALGTIKWYKAGTTASVATGQTLVITAGDIANSATYTAQLEDGE